MKNIQLLINSAQDIKKPKKQECFDSLPEIVENLDAETYRKTLEHLTRIYKYFEPKVAKKATTDVFAWVAQAISTDETRTPLMEVYVDDENIVATDGCRLHLVPKEKGMEKGYYNKHKTKIDLDYIYPNYRQVIPEIETEGFTLNKDKLKSFMGKDHKSKLAPVYKINGAKFKKNYIDEAMAIKNQPLALAYMRDEESPLLIEFYKGRRAVIMPILI